MQQKKHNCASICDGLPTLFANHPWWVDQDQMLQNNDIKDHIVYTTRDPPSQRRYQIPSLGRRIRGCFHGWVVLSNHPYNDMWSLWNPVASKIICLPRLEKGDRECCLSSPPDDHGSIFMLTTTRKHTIVFCRLDRRRKRYKWLEMSYAKQMSSIVGCDGGILHSLTCCNGKVYALCDYGCRISSFVILVDIAVKGTEIVISLLRYLDIPSSFYNDGCSYTFCFLKGCCTELFSVKVRVTDSEAEKKTVGGVFVFKLDEKNTRWEKMEHLKDAAIFLDIGLGSISVYYSPSEELGSYVHLLDRCGEVIHSYDFKNKIVALSFMPTNQCAQGNSFHPKDHLFICSAYRLQEEDMIIKNNNNYCNKITKIEEEGNMESRLVNIPFDVLKTIMEFCVGVEYLNFRAVCKKCHLAAPMIRWGGKQLRAYSLVSPWLMVLDKDRGVTSFTDPMSGDNYFIKTPQEFIGNVQILCSMYGWLLIRRFEGSLMFYNPFTSDIRQLPNAPCLDTYYFSAPPTSSDCMVVGFKNWGEWHVYVHFVAAREPSWRRFRLLKFSGDNNNSSRSSFHFATLYARNLYALYNNGGIGFVEDTEDDNGGHYYTWRKVLAKGPSSGGLRKQNFLMKCDQQLLQVIMGKFGGRVEVFKLSNDSSTEWEKIESLGRYTIYICGKSCICMEAKMPAMANKIYFPRLHSENRKIVFYSLETTRYHTSNIEEESLWSLVGTTYHINPHVWIEPSWS